jgi:Fe-S cluster biogenesis protein NfuA
VARSRDIGRRSRDNVANDELKEALAKVIAPMVESDEGELFLVEDKGREVHVHLRGRFAGCPGNELVTEQVLRPLIHSIRPQAKVQVSSGALLPDGAERIRPSGTSAD